jgi:hypothetical protein
MASDRPRSKARRCQVLDERAEMKIRITLTVTDSLGNVSVASGSVHVAVSGPPTAAFDFDWNGLSGASGSSTVWSLAGSTTADVRLRGDRSASPTNNIVEYLWTSNGQVIGTTEDILVTFPKGAYSLQLSIKDIVGNSASILGNLTLATTATPSISSISPGTPTVSGSNQTVTLEGRTCGAGDLSVMTTGH